MKSLPFLDLIRNAERSNSEISPAQLKIGTAIKTRGGREDSGTGWSICAIATTRKRGIGRGRHNRRTHMMRALLDVAAPPTTCFTEGIALRRWNGNSVATARKA